METQLTTDEIKAKQQLLQDYEPAIEALAILEKIRADLTPVLMSCGQRKTGYRLMVTNPSGRSH